MGIRSGSGQRRALRVERRGRGCSRERLGIRSRHGVRPEMPEAATAVCLIEARIHPAFPGAGARDPAAHGSAGQRARARVTTSPRADPADPQTSRTHTPIDEYLWRTRPDGTPFNPWLRSHLGLGGRLAQVRHSAMTIAGSLAEWREWTGRPFDTSALVEVEGALKSRPRLHGEQLRRLRRAQCVGRPRHRLGLTGDR
jgi:hypothetical protein